MTKGLVNFGPFVIRESSLFSRHSSARRRLHIKLDISLRALPPRPILSHASLNQHLPLFRMQAEQVAGAAKGLAQRQGAVLLEAEAIGRRRSGLQVAIANNRVSQAARLADDWHCAVLQA